MRVCPFCNQAKDVTQYATKNTTKCRSCKHKADWAKKKARKAAKPLHVPTVEEFEITVEEPPKTPVEEALHHYAEGQAKRDLRREHSALITENQRLNSFIQEMVEAQRPPDLLIYQKPLEERHDAVACAIASDWHVEEEVIKATVHNLNEFNLGIAEERARWFFVNLLRLAESQARDCTIRQLILWALGDFFSGWIHKELMASTLLPPGKAARFWVGLFISGIKYLLRESKFDIVIEALPGNHGRMTDQVFFSDPTGTSLETIAYHLIAAAFQDEPRVTVNVADQAMIYREFFEGFRVRAIHGYELKYGGGVGGITIPVNKAIAQWDKAVRADLTIFGHLHQFFDGGRFLGNGSLIGYNTYAQAIKAEYEEARQAFFTIHARHGGLKSVVAPIWLDNAHKK